MKCANCYTVESTRPYGLCETCYFKPEIHKRFRAAPPKPQQLNLMADAVEVHRLQRDLTPKTIIVSNSCQPCSQDSQNGCFTMGVDLGAPEGSYTVVQAILTVDGVPNRNGNIYTKDTLVVMSTPSEKLNLYHNMFSMACATPPDRTWKGPLAQFDYADQDYFIVKEDEFIANGVRYQIGYDYFDVAGIGNLMKINHGKIAVRSCAPATDKIGYFRLGYCVIEDSYILDP